MAKNCEQTLTSDPILAFFLKGHSALPNYRANVDERAVQVDSESATFY